MNAKEFQDTMHDNRDGGASHKPALIVDALSWHFFVVLVISSVVLYARFFHAQYFGYFQDDFFYYAQIARNVALHGQSTFDGLHATNGYHPLWLFLLAALYKLFAGRGFFIAVQTVALVCSAFVYLGCLRTLRTFAPSLEFARAAALLLSLYTLLLLRFGMEITLALPLGIWAVSVVLDPEFVWAPRQTLAFGLLACATVLARLDSVLFFLLLCALQFLTMRAPFAVMLKRTLLLAACFLPFYMYLVTNEHYFHTLLPISAMAKDLKPLLPPSIEAARTVLHAFSWMGASVVYPGLLAMLCGLWLLRSAWPKLQQPMRVTVLCLLLFPLLQIVVLSFSTDWPVGSWPWYFYPFTFAALGTACVSLLRSAQLATQSPPDRSSKKKPLALYALAALYLLYSLAYALTKRPDPEFMLAQDAASFLQQHHGIYAMGDQAGAVEYFGEQPIVQLEGLTMDRPFVDVMRRRESLKAVLQQYGVDYFIRIGLAPSGCFEVSEPAQAGALSPHMTGHLCAPPQATFVRSGQYMAIYRASDVEP